MNYSHDYTAEFVVKARPVAELTPAHKSSGIEFFQGANA
jgi:hypothetical protein